MIILKLNLDQEYKAVKWIQVASESSKMD